ncbi:PilW family protein [Dyella sp. 20L07]|uniref:PilW family protein n=1 Tax=Dyella sp. 20L07 TaxID=3384240 RepID=UPI003D29F047
MKARVDTCSRHRPLHASARSASGFTLIELMVAMLLGLVVIAGVGSVFLSNQQVYRTNKGLSDVQDSTRIAFEMMARDIRVAGLTGCGNSGRFANVVSGAKWWSNWNNTIVGYTSSQADIALATNARAKDTESIILLGAEGSGVSVKANASPAFTINESSTDMVAGDVVIVCDPDHAALVQLSSVNGTTLTHAASGNPGNCTTDLSYPTVCSSGNTYVFAPNAQIAKLNAVDWYVGTNDEGGTSLYRLALTTVAGEAKAIASEMVRDVTGLTFLYHQTGDNAFLAADAVNWSQVDAVQVTMTVISSDKRVGVDAKPVSRTFTSTTTMRNRVP